MKTLAQDSANDIVLECHDLKVVSGIEAYSVIIGDAIRTVLGELQLDIGRGVDYFGTVFKTANAVPLWRMNVEKIINEYDFVKSIEYLDAKFDSSGRILSYTVKIITDAGELTLEG